MSLNEPAALIGGNNVQRVLIAEDPFAGLDGSRWWLEQGMWPAWWIGAKEGWRGPGTLIFRLRFEAEQGRRFRIHVAGDERYELFLDGERVGWGSERGSGESWAFDSYDAEVGAGLHEWRAEVLVARKHGLRSQVSVEPGFLLASDWEDLPTGRAAWEVQGRNEVQFAPPFPHDFFSVGWNSRFASQPEGEWKIATKREPGSAARTRNRYGNIHLLTPARLPVSEGKEFRGGQVRHVGEQELSPLLGADHRPDEAGAWVAWWSGSGELSIPAGTERRVLIDLEDYVCARPEITANGTGEVFLTWAESLHEDADFRAKGDRSAIEGKFFHGVGDVLVVRQEAVTYRPAFIRTGRFCLLTVKSGPEALVLKSVRLVRAEYPLEISATVATDRPEWDRLLERCRRTIRASCHDAIIDGPYYEQMQWIGDIGQAALALYTMSPDTRLVRKALETFDHSRGADGLMPARWPARDSLFIPGFCLHWIGVLHDFALWRDEPEFVRERLPGMRAVLDRFLAWVGEDGLLRVERGWKFTDWVPGWPDGMAPHDSDGVSGAAQWQLIRALSHAARLEEAFGDQTMELRYRLQAGKLGQAADAFWNREAGLYSDRRETAAFSEHTQAFALLSGCVPNENRPTMLDALTGGTLTRATPAFRHYVFEALAVGGRAGCIVPQLDEWHAQEKIGLLTTPETAEPTRSDCHGWSAHPHYHFFASLLGVRPGAMGFRTVIVEPQWDRLSQVQASMPHPGGEILISVTAGEIRIVLPENVGGIFRNGLRDTPLHGGENIVRRVTIS